MARQNRLRGIGFVICFALKADQTVEALETLMVVENLPKLSGIIPAGEHDCVVPGWRVLESFSRSPLSGTSATSCKSPRFESRCKAQNETRRSATTPSLKTLHRSIFPAMPSLVSSLAFHIHKQKTGHY